MRVNAANMLRFNTGHEIDFSRYRGLDEDMLMALMRHNRNITVFPWKSGHVPQQRSRRRAPRKRPSRRARRMLAEVPQDSWFAPLAVDFMTDVLNAVLPALRHYGDTSWIRDVGSGPEECAICANLTQPGLRAPPCPRCRHNDMHVECRAKCKACPFCRK